jgi:hypothetical protein
MHVACQITDCVEKRLIAQGEKNFAAQGKI